MKTRILILALLMACRPFAWAVFEEDALFSAHFDGTLKADKAAGNPNPVKTVGSEFVPGRHGQATVISGEKHTFAYETKGNLNPNEGTLVFWFNVLDWEPNKAQNGEILVAAPPGLAIYHRDLLAFYLTDGAGSGLGVESYAINVNFTRAWWHQNEWHQMAVTWKAGEGRIFLDDAEVASRRNPTRPPYRFEDLLWFGNGGGVTTLPYATYPGTKGSGGRTAIDDLTIYGRALESEEIKLLFNLDGAPTSGAGPLVKLTEYVPVEKLEALAIVRHLPDYRNKMKSARLIFQSGGKTIARHDLPPLVKGQTHDVLSTTKIPPGDYAVVCQVLDPDNKVVAEQTTPFTRHRRPEWVGNNIGKDKIVPPPFEPVRFANGAAACWGREYRYGTSLLPDQVVSQQKTLLAAPISVAVADEHENWVNLRSESPKVLSQDPTQVTLLTQGKAAGLTVSAKQEIEYDGSVWVTLTVEPGASKQLHGLTVSVPMKPEYAEFANPGFWFDGGTLASTLQGKAVRDFPFVPSFYLGTDKLGLQWLASSARNWVHPNKSTSFPDPSTIAPMDQTDLSRSALPIRLQREGDPEQPTSVTLLCRFVGAPVDLPAPRVFSFCLQAIPYKPQPTQMWFYRRLHPQHFLPPWTSPPPATETKVGRSNTIAIFEGSAMNMAVPKISDRDEVTVPRLATEEEVAKVKKYEESAREAGMPLIFYFSVHFVQPDTDEEKLCYPEWDTCNGGRVCLKSSYQDYLIHALKKLMDQANLRAFYLDNTIPFPCQNAIHGCAYTNADGQLEGEVDLRAEHEFRKRLYVMLHQKWGKDFIVEENSSGYRIGPWNDFSTVLLDGEGVRLVNLDKDGKPTLHARAFDMLRSVFNPALWSAPILWFGNSYLPEGRDRMYWEGAPIEPWELMEGLLRLHGISTDYTSGQHIPGVYRLFRAEDLFDLRGAVEFTPWYEAGQLVQTDQANAKVSVYRRERRVLLFASNTSDKAVPVKITVDRAKLGLPSGNLRWQDAYRGEYAVMHEDNVLNVTMPAFGFRMLMYGVPDRLW